MDVADRPRRFATARSPLKTPPLRHPSKERIFLNEYQAIEAKLRRIGHELGTNNSALLSLFLDLQAETSNVDDFVADLDLLCRALYSSMGSLGNETHQLLIDRLKRFAR